MASTMSISSPSVGAVSMAASTKLHAALGKQLPQRCKDIGNIIRETSSKELHAILPELFESMFGFGNHPGWGIGKVIRSQTYEFAALKELLGAEGPVMKLLYQLMSDPYFQYEFPLTSLPFATQRLLEHGALPNFYVDKLQINQGGKPCNAVLLNPFEYYFFHFAHYLVNPHIAKTSNWVNPSDSLYPVLLEEYFNYFLPLDGKTVPQHSQPVSKSGLSQPSSPRLSSTHSTPGRTSLSGSFNAGRSPLDSSLLRQKFISAQPSQAPEMETETWRTQTFLQILVDFWLNQTSLSTDRYAQPDVISDTVLPSSDHVRVVRMLVKHLHYFTNSARGESVQSPYSVSYYNHWEEFKRSAMQQFVQRKLYGFLRNAFQHWPLDASFRLVLETWLSYLQPWRYVDPSLSNRDRDPEASVRAVEEKWRFYIVENFLFYTVLFQNVLQRMLRMDLSSAKNAYMLFRVTKVYTLPSYREMVDDAERMLEVSCGVGRMGDMGSPFLAGSHPSNIGSVIIQHMCEMEGPSYQYSSIFSSESLTNVRQLLTALTLAKQSVQTLGNKNGDPNNSSFLGWLFGASVDYNASKFVSWGGVDDVGYGESKKAEVHLDNAHSNLCYFFHLETADKPEKSVTWGNHSSRGLRAESLSPDVYDAGDGPKLTPLGRYQLMNGLRRFEVAYRGDPDLQPIRSYEIPLLVRMCHGVSSYVNNVFSGEIEALYHREGLVGRLAQQLFPPPEVPTGKSLSPLSRRQLATHRKPRFSLRWVASYQNLGYLLFLYVFLYMWLGTGFVGYLFILIALIFLRALLKAFFDSPKVKEL